MNDCLFCKIINGDIPSTKIYEDDKVFVFADIEPTAPIHWLAIPKEHIERLSDVNEANSEVISHIYEVISSLASQHEEFKNGFRVVSNCGEAAGQSVFHIHFHVLAGRDFAWPAG